MIEGVAWSYPAPDEVYADPDVLRFSVLVPGELFKGRPASYWRKIEGSLELADRIVDTAGHRSQNLTGFTLFYHAGMGWQMSVRRERESGWDVGIIDDDKAKAILSLLENSGHPDGPWRVKSSEARPTTQATVVATHRAAQARLTAALLGWAGV